MLYYNMTVIAIQTVDRIPADLYIDEQVLQHNRPETALDIKKLEDRVDELISTVERLRSENKTLRQSQTHLISERDKLMTKTEQARSRVDAMIQRLRDMDNE